MTDDHIGPLASRLAQGFYIDTPTAREALHRGRPLNVIHFASGYKFDIFSACGDPDFEIQLARSKVQEVTFNEGETIACSLATAEDTILAKLAWYRAGGEQSERQWNDVRGIRSVQTFLLDRAYMKHWAQHLKVDDLLERLLSEEESA